MTTKGVADILFCLDASDSMQPCFRGMREHIGNFLAGLGSNTQVQWDWRIDFLAHSAGAGAFRAESVNCATGDLIPVLYQQRDDSRLFTRDLDLFRRRLAKVELLGDEAPLIALDCCLDFPWRDAARCHRVLVMMTDEPFETGAMPDEQAALLTTVREKLQKLHVMLYLVAPESDAFSELSAAEKAEYQPIRQAGQGMQEVNFQEVLLEIGKSVSVLQWQLAKPETVPRGVFCQAEWGSGGSMDRRDRR